MNLTIKNLAKISEANVSIDGITVIAGYNSTGKSTISKALVSCMRAYSNLNNKIRRQRVMTMSRTLDDIVSAALPDVLYFDEDDSLRNLATKLVDNPSFELTRSMLNSIFEGGLDESKRPTVLKYIEDNFSSIIADIEKKRLVPDQEYVTFIVNNQFRNTFDQQINTIGSEKPCTIDLIAREDIHIEIVNNRVTGCPVLTLKESSPFYIEPKHMLDDSSYRRNYRIDSYLYSYLLPDEAVPSIGLTLEQYKQREHAAEIVNNLADNVMHGLLRSADESMIFHDNDFQSDISIRNVASGIKSMALTARLVENGFLTSKGLLIIDEPEVNLHPEWQIRFANFLVQLNKELDIQILLTTHSPYFLRAIEVFSSQYNNSDKLKLYMTSQSAEQHNLYFLKDVTENSNLIYKQLYLPLESL